MAKTDFKFDFSPSMVKELLHGNIEWNNWYNAMCEILPLWEINTVERVAGFIAQCGHESRNFSVLTENLNYSAAALNRIFPKYFIRAGKDSKPYHRQPEKIANIIYANRMGNGDEASGDGWKYRGGGILQLTGCNNYTAFAKEMEISVDDSVDYVRTKKGALDSACWFWDTNNINRYCDDMDIIGMTKRINGGTIGLEDRQKHWEHALDVLGGDFESWSIRVQEKLHLARDIKKGCKGADVIEIQEKLSITPADGIFGPGTEEVVKLWQEHHGLFPDGIIGPKTAKLMLG